MSKRLGVLFLLAAFGAGVGAMALAQPEKPQGQPPAAPTAEQFFEALTRLSTPVKEHELFKSLAGDWVINGKYDFGAGSIGFTGQSRTSVIIGGRFLQFDSTTGADGKPQVETRLVLGYDTRKGKYTLWGIDSFGTYSATAEGDHDAELKKLVLSGEVRDGERRTRFRHEIRMQDVDTLVLELHIELTPTNWTRVAEQTYSRKKW